MTAAAPPRPGRRAALAGWSALVLALTATQWELLWTHRTTLEALDGWFWTFTPWPLAAALLAPIGVGLAVGLVFVWLLRARPRWALVALIVVGFGVQHGLSRVDGKGLDGLRRNMSHRGHQTFMNAAVGLDGDLSWVSDYEGTLDRYDRLGRMAKSKPPGTSLLYVATERAANLPDPDAPYLQRKARMGTFAAWTWPLWSMLALIPLFVAGRRWGIADVGLLAGALFVVVPSVQLMTMHVDQAFLPSLVLFPVLAGLLAVGRGSWRLGLLSGALLYLVWFVSFSTLGVGVVLAAGAVGAGVKHRGGGREGLASVAVAGASAAGGLLLCHLLALWLLEYDAPLRFRRALRFHEEFKQWDPRWRPTLRFAVLNTTEWVHWVGLPLVGLWLVSAVRGFRSRGSALHALSAGVAVTVVVTALTGRTEGETARLWLWLVPFACLGAAQVLAEIPAKWRRFVVPVVIAAQAITVALLKLRQDFQ